MIVKMEISSLFPSPYGDYKYRQAEGTLRSGFMLEECFRLLTEIINTDPLAQNPVILPSQATLCVPKANHP